MAEKHLIVFGDNAEHQIKKNLGKIKSYKDAQWLYDGILFRENEEGVDLVALIFKDPKFAPDAIIDNGKWISPKLFGNNITIWQGAIRQCFAMVSWEQIHCYTFVD